VSVERRRLHVQGVVQGVGFRPFVYSLATRHALAGFVSNQSDGVHIEVEGSSLSLEAFQSDLRSQPPPLARIDSLKIDSIPTSGDRQFTIHESAAQLGPSTPISPDVATCSDCLRELFDPSDRRFLYPFINCTNCGPRYTIIKDIPYDRPFTTMAAFPMCAACNAEYHDPRNRRFHAQPNACPDCGPNVWLYPGGEKSKDALDSARAQLREGKIVAIKGIGGFHLACDAMDSSAVGALRRRKNRGDKPFALMARDLKEVRKFADVNEDEAEQLTCRERPIVLLRRKKDSDLSPLVSPGTALVGFMLPYSPLHHLLLDDRPLVMTSGNLSDEPICRENEEALSRLSSLADSFLLHNRDIHVVCDDSVVRLHQKSEVPIRRARGFAPLPVNLKHDGETVLAVGAELKSTFCLTKGSYAYLSPHIGDMENLETMHAMERGLEHFRSIFRCEPSRVVCDMHPGYLSTRWAEEFSEANGIPIMKVQHHHAHVASLAAEHGLDPAETVIGVAYDGTGYGTDRTIWGGEVLVASSKSFRRAAHLRYVPMPGGDAAIKKPYRMALAHLAAADIDWESDLPCVAAAVNGEIPVLRKQIATRFNSVDTSSMGRLFDAVASILGICHFASYEGQAAIELEMAVSSTDAEAYRFDLSQGDEIVMDPAPVLRAIVSDFRHNIPPGTISGRFHASVANCIAEICSLIKPEAGTDTVALTGGVFQNVRLLELAKRKLNECGFKVITHHLVPPNDGGLSLGQAVIGLNR